MNLKNTLLAFFSIIFLSKAYPQSTVFFTSNDFHYKEGLSLLNENKYGAARLAFDKYLENGKDKDKLAMTEYYIAYCGIQLDHADAESLVENFIQDHPNHPKAGLAYYELGNLKYKRNKYADAIKYFEKLYFPYLPRDIQPEARFKLGYSYFTLKEFDKAYEHFNELKREENQFKYASSYYSGYINFQKEEYDRAYFDFIRAGENEYYAQIVPEMINKTLYKQKRYGDVIDYSNDVLKKSNVKNSSEFYLYLAEAYYKKNDFENSAKYFDQYLELARKASPEIMFRVADARHRAGNTEGAIAGFKEAALLDNALGQIASLYLGNLYVKTGNKSLASAAYKAAMEAGFDKKIQQQAHFNYAKVAYNLGNYTDAIQAFNDYLNEYPQATETTEVNELLTDAYFRTNNYEAAIRHFEKIKNKSDKVKAAYQLITFNEGSRLFNAGQYRKAIELFEKSISFPQNQDILLKALYWQGEAYYLAARYDDAKNSYAAIFRHDPSGQSDQYLEARYGIGYIYFNEKEYEKALPHFRYFAEHGASNSKYKDALVRLADTYYTTKQYNRALEVYDRILTISSANKDYASYQKGIIYGIMGNINSADQNFDRVINDFRESRYRDDAMFQKAQFNFENGNYKKAIDGFSQLMSAFPNSNFIPYAYQSRALAHANTGNHQSAADNYKKIIDHFPHHQVAENALLGLQQELTTLGKSGQFDKYLTAYKAANPDKTNFENIEFESAKTLYFDQKYERAAAAFQKFVNEYPNSGLLNEALYLQGDAYFRSGKKEEALKVLAKLKDNENYAKYERVIERLAELEFSVARYREAIKYYRKYENLARNKKSLYRAWSALMESYYALKKYDSVSYYARNILEKGLVTADAEGKAQLYLGKSAYEQNNYTVATDHFLNAINTAKDVNGAEAQYLLAMIYHKQGKYQNSLETLFDLNKNFSIYEYWLGKSFLLIADNYRAMDETFQAKATLESIVANADNKEILKEAQKKLEEIEAEKIETPTAPDTIEIINPESQNQNE